MTTHSFPLQPIGQRVREALLPIAILLACGVGLTNNSVDPDLWGHVQYGRDVLRDGILHPTATYTYTAVGYRWINHENISELLFASGMDTIGPTALLWIKFALGMAIFTWFMRQAFSRGASPVAIGVVFLLGSLNLMHFWLIRPQLLSYVCFAVMITLVQFVFAGWEGNWWLPSAKRLIDCDEASNVRPALAWSKLHWLWLLVPLQIVWTNSHGAFIAGACIAAAYLLGRALEIWLQFGRPGIVKAGYLLLILSVMLASTLVNPYGLELLTGLAQKLRTPRPEIIEWAPPEFFSVVWIQFWVLLAVWAVAVLFARRGRDFTQLAIVALVAWQSIDHRRHIAFLAILSIAWLTPLVTSLFARLQQQNEYESDKTTNAASVWQQIGCAITILLAIGLFVDQLQMLPVPRNRYPVDAFQYMADNDLTDEGKLVVQFEWAQYAILAFGQRHPNTPGLTVAFDGRFRTCYPQAVLDRYWDFDMGETPPGTRYRSPESPPVDGSRILTEGNPDLVLVGRYRPAAVGVMQAHSADWTLIYQDSLAQLWGRRNKYDNPHDPHYIPVERRLISANCGTGLVPFPAVPQS